MNSNRARVEAVQNRRRSGAAGKHGDRRTKRLRTRATVKTAAIREGR
jgi:hypothetical protein